MSDAAPLLLIAIGAWLFTRGRRGGPPGAPAVNPLAEFPVAGRTSYTDTWGAPRPGGRTHQGTDVFAAEGTPVVAAHAGLVEQKTTPVGGQTVTIYGDGVTSYYAHLSAFEGQSAVTVNPGTVVGYVGSTGDAAGGPPHLHFQLWIAHKLVNPYAYLRSIT